MKKDKNLHIRVNDNIINQLKYICDILNLNYSEFVCACIYCYYDELQKEQIELLEKK